MKPYERLEAWKRAHELALATYRSTERFPPSERFGLTSQIRRAALSIPTNIAEGSAKRGPREFRRFLDISLGSLAELCYLLRFAKDLGALSAEDWARLERLRDEVGALTGALHRSMRRALTKTGAG